MDEHAIAASRNICSVLKMASCLPQRTGLRLQIRGESRLCSAGLKENQWLPPLKHPR